MLRWEGDISFYIYIYTHISFDFIKCDTTRYNVINYIAVSYHLQIVICWIFLNSSSLGILMNESEEKPNMTLGTKENPPRGEDSSKEHDTDFPMSDATHDSLEEELLTHVANSKAIFKSQQKEEPELTFEEKRAIAGKLLGKSRCLFLSKFGHHLKEEHLEYFSKSEDYETAYHVNRLRRYFNNFTRRIDVRNRRYEALKALIQEGEYFSECEMMKRNPLLYEHLVGQYLTEEEKKARDSVDSRNVNYVDILMETIERDKLQRQLRSQQKEEDSVREENNSDSDDDSRDSVTSKTRNSNKQTYVQWGETMDKTTNNNEKSVDKKLQNSKTLRKISKEEIQLLRQEFLTNMYQSFLDGKDKDFDYRYIYCANQYIYKIL